MSTMEQALRDALADLLTEAGYMAQQLAHRGLPGVPGDSVDRAIASAKAALTAARPAPGGEAPGDWVMVPRVATEAMGRAGAAVEVTHDWINGEEYIQSDSAVKIYAAMLSAAPAEISQAQAQAMREALRDIAEAAPDADMLGVQPGAEYWCTVAVRRQNLARAALPPEPPR